MRWMLYAGITTVFVLGGVAGALVGVMAERDRMQKMERGGPGLVGEIMGRRLEQDLKLNPNQARRVRQIYAAARPQVQQLDRERREKLRAIMESTHPQIMEILNPRQKERFLQLQQRLQQRLRLKEADFPEKPGPPFRRGKNQTSQPGGRPESHEPGGREEDPVPGAAPVPASL